MQRDSKRGPERIGELRDRCVARLDGLGYSPGYVADLAEIWRRFIVFAGGPEQKYSSRLIPKFIKHDDDTRRRPGRNRFDPKRGFARLAMPLMTEMRDRGSFSLHISSRQNPLPDWLHGPFAAYQRFCREKKGMAEESIQKNAEYVRHFLLFFARQDGRAWEKLSAPVISQFLRTLPHLKCATRRQRMGALRSFFRAMFCLGVLEKDWADSIPSMAPAFDAAVPYPWSPKDVRRLLDAVDRSTSVGKRDYAFFLLVARLGLRAHDATALRLEDFDWEKNTIRFVQRKTKIAHLLPLLPDVGLAVIDYLRHGRPASSCRNVFLRHRGSADKPLGRTAMAATLRILRRRIDLPVPRNHFAGLHSLRHTLATRLLEEGTAWSTISGVLGHTNPDTTQIYAKSSTLLLRKVALDPEEVRHG